MIFKNYRKPTKIWANQAYRRRKPQRYILTSQTDRRKSKQPASIGLQAAVLVRKRLLFFFQSGIHFLVCGKMKPMLFGHLQYYSGKRIDLGTLLSFEVAVHG